MHIASARRFLLQTYARFSQTIDKNFHLYTHSGMGPPLYGGHDPHPDPLHPSSKAAFNSDFVPFEKRESQKLLTHFVHTLYYTPSEKQMGTQVIAAALSGSMVSVLEQPSTNSTSTVSENIRRKGSDSVSHSYVATEVTRPNRTAKEIVEKALSAADLNEQVADIVKAFTDGNATAAANLVVFRSRDWISRRLHDLRIFTATDPSPKHILAVLSDLRLSASNSTLVDLVGAAKFKLWGLSEEETVKYQRSVRRHTMPSVCLWQE
ncbi:hypothetical protein B0H16DRAFT_1827582 [Mycena metata]|uniref:Uncharacterized protein n=1 Tax=Mycena metata TaxID=1033252 RepID=A0AAD7GU20_9AGAR|nr:hypothetical protein B0H16DRAFT_1827582 [Mycena metata]